MTTIEPTFEIVPAELNLAPEAKHTLELSFSGFFAEAARWKEQAATITSPKVARTARLEIKALRVAAEKKRKDLKEDSLRMGKAIDGANNILLSVIVPIENQLEGIEKAEERRLAAEREAMIAARLEDLRPYLAPEMPAPDVGSMTPEQFASALEDAKFLHTAKLEAAAKLEADRIAREKAETAERERIRLENERLKKEADEREAAMKAERAKAERERLAVEAGARKEREKIEAAAKLEREEAERQLAAERAAREKLEREAKAKRDAEEAKRKADEAAAKKAAKAPDKEKLMKFADKVSALTLPDLSSHEGKDAMHDINVMIDGLVDLIRDLAAGL